MCPESPVIEQGDGSSNLNYCEGVTPLGGFNPWVLACENCMVFRNYHQTFAAGVISIVPDFSPLSWLLIKRLSGVVKFHLIFGFLKVLMTFVFLTEIERAGTDDLLLSKMSELNEEPGDRYQVLMACL